MINHKKLLIWHLRLCVSKCGGDAGQWELRCSSDNVAPAPTSAALYQVTTSDQSLRITELTAPHSLCPELPEKALLHCITGLVPLLSGEWWGGADSGQCLWTRSPWRCCQAELGASSGRAESVVATKIDLTAEARIWDRDKKAELSSDKPLLEPSNSSAGWSYPCL